MKILSIEHQVPETRLDNNDVIERMERESSSYLSRAELDTVRNHMLELFEATASRYRHMTAGKQRPIDIQKECAERALALAGVKAKDLDFILYGGVTRGYLVPSSASALQYAIGADGVSCFDVLDACASWARAMQVANSFIASGVGKLGLIVNCECGAYHDCNPWPIKTLEGLEERTAAFTLGEAATATVVTELPQGAPPPEFYARSFGEYGDLATLPIVDSKHYMLHERQPTGRVTFFTRPQELTFTGLKLGRQLMEQVNPLGDRVADVFIPHAGAEPSVDMFIKITNLQHRQLVLSFSDYGNTISASLPLGLSTAVKDGRIKRGDTVFCATIAAGISVVAIYLTY